jgi:hypothetical protein
MAARTLTSSQGRCPGAHVIRPRRSAPSMGQRAWQSDGYTGWEPRSVLASAVHHHGAFVFVLGVTGLGGESLCCDARLQRPAASEIDKKLHATQPGARLLDGPECLAKRRLRVWGARLCRPVAADTECWAYTNRTDTWWCTAGLGLGQPSAEGGSLWVTQPSHTPSAGQHVLAKRPCACTTSRLRRTACRACSPTCAVNDAQ